MSKISKRRACLAAAIEPLEQRMLLTAVVVNTTADSTDVPPSTVVSLRDAVNIANKSTSATTITFSPTVFATPKTITLTGGGLELKGAKPITITGPAVGVTVEGTGVMFTVDGGVTAAMSNLTITGELPNTPVFYSTGVVNSGTLTITGSVISNHIGDSPYGDLGGGIVNSGDLILRDSTLSGNAISYGNGAGLYNSGTANVTDCAVVNNSAINPNIYDAHNEGVGGGIDNTGTLTLTNSTLSGNSSGNGGTAIENDATATVKDCTITGNTGQRYSAYTYGINNNGMLTMANTIVAGNTSNFPSGATDVYGAVVSQGHNLIGQVDSSTGWVASDKLGTTAHPLDPDLRPLGYYGGPTQTEPALTGSPVIGAGSAALVPAGVTTDQRGYSRVVGGKVDIGAVELQPASAITVKAPAAQHVVAGTTSTVNLGSFTDPGNSGPYTLDVYWGDGSANSYYPVSAAGSLGSETHRFVKTGSLSGSIIVINHLGEFSNIVPFSIAAAAQPLTSIVVNTVKDQVDAPGSKTVSLRDAVDESNAAIGPVTITFDSKVFASAQTIDLSLDRLELDNPFGLITVTGPAAGVTVVGAGSYGGVFEVAGDVSASLSHLTLSGSQSGLINDGTTTLNDSTITGNMNTSMFSYASNPIGYADGAITNRGTLTVTDSTISNNASPTAMFRGGGNGTGGGVYNDATMTIVNSTIAQNSAGDGGGIYNDTAGNLSLSDCTVSGNTSTDNGGGLLNLGKITLANTIVAGNTDTGSAPLAPDVSGAITSKGHNLIGEKDGSTGWISSDLTGSIAHPLSANLSILGNFGGPTQTMLPLSGSPALGAGSVSLIPSGVTTDQRGLSRVVNGKVDIGAVEIQQETPYSGTPAPFGLIQAENYDKGGPGAGYYNPDNANHGGLYRPTEGVGIGAIPSADGGGYFVGWTLPGEYLNYTVTVAATGTYTINFRVASQPKGGTFHLNVDGKNVTGELSVPSTGDWNTYTIVSKSGVSLTAGTHVLQLVIDSHGTGTNAAGNFDWIQAVKT